MRPSILRRAVEENGFVNPPPGFVSQAEREEKHRDQERIARELLHEYEQQKRQILDDLEAFLTLPPERQVAPMLEAWEKVERTQGRAPDPQERAKRQILYINNLPSPDQMLASRLKDLQCRMQHKATEQGIEAPTFG